MDNMKVEDNNQNTDALSAWIDRVINGIGGFKSWEDHEYVIFHTSREEGIAAFVIRCLANPKCEGSEDVLKAIQERRKTMPK